MESFGNANWGWSKFGWKLEILTKYFIFIFEKSIFLKIFWPFITKMKIKKKSVWRHTFDLNLCKNIKDFHSDMNENVCFINFQKRKKLIPISSNSFLLDRKFYWLEFWDFFWGGFNIKGCYLFTLTLVQQGPSLSIANPTGYYLHHP